MRSHFEATKSKIITCSQCGKKTAVSSLGICLWCKSPVGIENIENSQSDQELYDLVNRRTVLILKLQELERKFEGGNETAKFEIRTVFNEINQVQEAIEGW